MGSITTRVCMHKHTSYCQINAVSARIHRLDLTGGMSVAPRMEPNFVAQGRKTHHWANISINESPRHMLADGMIKCHHS